MKKRLENLIDGLVQEEKAEKKKFHDAKLALTINERIILGTTLYPLEYIGFHFDYGKEIIFDFKFNIKRGYGEFSKSSPITLFSTNADFDRIGKIVSLKNDEISLSLNLESEPKWMKEGKIGIDLRSDAQLYDVQKKSIQSQLEDPHPALLALYAKEEIFKNEYFEVSTLNDSQNKAVSACLSENPLTIIHGPPGTGKTRTLIEAAKALVKRKAKIILLAPSNAAVDHIVRQLNKEQLTSIRLGNSPKISPDIQGNTLDEIINNDRGYLAISEMTRQKEALQKSAFKFKRTFTSEDQQNRRKAAQEIRNLSRDIRKENALIKAKILDDARIICATIDSAAFSKTLNNYTFDVVLIDESGQATEPAIWSVAKLAKKIILAGDPFQLPPTIFSREAMQLGLDKSILEIAQETGHPSRLLNVQYRMLDELIGFSNTFFYKNALTSHDSNKIAKNIDEYSAIEFIDTAGSGFEEKKTEDGAIINEGELKVIQKRMEGLKDFILISPYRGQVNLLMQELNLKPSQVNTVDSYQGQEKAIVLISLVRSNAKGEIGFLSEYRRMNVALTRAQKKLIVIGDSATIGNDKFYSSFLNYVEKNGSYRTVWEFDLF